MKFFPRPLTRFGNIRTGGGGNKGEGWHQAVHMGCCKAFAMRYINVCTYIRCWERHFSVVFYWGQRYYHGLGLVKKTHQFRWNGNNRFHLACSRLLGHIPPSCLISACNSMSCETQWKYCVLQSDRWLNTISGPLSTGQVQAYNPRYESWLTDLLVSSVCFKCLSIPLVLFLSC